MTETLTPTRRQPVVTHDTACPHCHKRFEASVDLRQPPRLQGAKCPHCKLFVPARLVLESLPVEGGDTGH